MTSDDRSKSAAGQNQGEGDRESAERYNEATRKFVDSGKVEQAARDAEKIDPQEAARAERAGKERAKEDDPAVQRDYRKGGK